MQNNQTVDRFYAILWHCEDGIVSIFDFFSHVLAERVNFIVRIEHN